MDEYISVGSEPMHKLLFSPEVTRKAWDLQTEKSDLQIFAVPSFDRMLYGRSSPYSHEKNFDDV
jgi:hypothetical protein